MENWKISFRVFTITVLFYSLEENIGKRLDTFEMVGNVQFNFQNAFLLYVLVHATSNFVLFFSLRKNKSREFADA